MEQNRKRLSWFMKLVLLCCGAVVALFVVSVIIFICFGTNTYKMGLDMQLTTVALQNLVVFILPVVVLALINKSVEGRRVLSTMWMERCPTFKSIALVVLVYIVALPAMNYLVNWNEGLHLPHALNDLERTLRAMEDDAKAITEQLLTTQSWGLMVVMVLLVGLLTGMGEEIFFRAGMLGSMRHGGVNRHVAIWVAAIIFSTIHMQFYGFVPRMLLGAWFGYLMLWSGEVWTPIIAHTLNNGAVVVCTFLANNHYINSNYLETLGLPGEGEKPWLAVASAMVTALVIYIFMHKRNKTITTS